MTSFAVGKETHADLRAALSPQLPEFLAKQRWFGAKARQISSAEVADIVPISLEAAEALLLFVRVKYADKAEDTYALPVLVQQQIGASGPSALRVPMPEGDLVLTDALQNTQFLANLLALIRNKATIHGQSGNLQARQTAEFSRLDAAAEALLAPKAAGAEQSNTSVIYGDRFILKFFRRLEQGMNPDQEIGTFLTETARFPHTPPLAGSLEYRSHTGTRMTQGILQAFVPNQGDAWRYTLGAVEQFYKVVAEHSENSAPVSSGADFARNSANPYLRSAALLGKRTAEMHAALSTETNDPAFASEPFTTEFQRTLEKSLIELTHGVLTQLRARFASLPDEWRAKAEALGHQEDEIIRRWRVALSNPIQAARTRIHGDYHLGQVLYTGSDIVIIDFEGEPARPLAERRIKRSPLQDVAGMLRSFHYAAFAPLLGEKPIAAKSGVNLSYWAEAWNRWVADRFLQSYFETAGSAPYLPKTHEETQRVLELHLLEKAIYELGYELNNRPTWIGIPLQGISALLSS